MYNRKKAVALEYSDDIPRIIAIAKGILFDKLIEIAEKNKITIYFDPDLTEVLSALKIGAEIPENLYRAVTQVLAYCYRMNEEFRSKIDGRVNKWPEE